MGLTGPNSSIKPEDCYTNGTITDWSCNYFNEIAVILLMVIFVISLLAVTACLAYCAYFRIQAKRQKEDYDRTI